MQKPVFVKLDQYQEVMNLVRTMRGKVNDARIVLHKVHQLKRDEEVELELWQTSLDQVDRKVALLEQSLQDPQRV